jgi:anti-sigma regulatory factor (Ser/Thr protein kinase)
MSVATPNCHSSLTIGTTIDELEKVAAFVDRFGADQQVPANTVNDLNVCLDEILNNTISYGYDDQGHHDIVITLQLAGDCLTVEIRDDGRAFDPTGAAPAAPKELLQSRKVGGLGIHFVRALMDEMEYRRNGGLNMLTLKKKLNKGGSNGNG